MKILRKIVIILGAAVLIAALIVAGWTYYAYRRPLPKQQGELSIEGMQRETRIYRDTWGVAHIYAATRVDLFFAQGFVHAQDRWWQMDVSRRIGRGTLSELLGQNDKVQSIDRLARTLGWDQIAQANWDAASPEARLALEAYTAGVNAYIEARSPGELALEYTVLDLRLDQVTVQPWTPQDSLAWAVALNWEMSGNASQELTIARDLTFVDAGMVSLLVPLSATPPPRLHPPAPRFSAGPV
ncbi:MAG TPA: penicillin acylase family protein [Aggregatilineaceae bacterium]|nr:penicillin acylase family protein [Aggregatilineaceae bacterium]